jgi:gliding motility-associated-like protein
MTKQAELFSEPKKHLRSFVLSPFVFFIACGSYASPKCANPSGSMGAINLTMVTTPVSADFFNGSTMVYNGSLTINASGGIAPYKFSLVGWGINNNGYFPQLAPGNYELQVSDASGQIADTTVIVNSIYPLPSVNFSAVVYPSSCSSSDGGFALIGSGGTPPYSYSIDGGVSFISSNIFDNLSQGIYTCFIKDANGMIAFIRSSPSLVRNFIYFNCNCCTYSVYANGSNEFSCTDSIGQLQVNANGGVPPYMYSIDGIHYYPGYAMYEGGHRFANLNPGTYRAYSKDSTGAISVTTTQIADYCTIDISYISTQSQCRQTNGSVTLHATHGEPPYSYTMDGIHFQTDSVFNNLAAGNYSFTVKDASQLSNSLTVIVPNACLSVDLNVTGDDCGMNNGTITAVGTGGQTPYSYSIDGIHFQTNNIFKGLAAGNYNITIKDAGGNTANAAIAIAAMPGPQINLSIAPTICGKTNGSIIINELVDTIALQFSISNGNNFQNSNSFSNLDSGTYIILVKDANGCTANDTVYLATLPLTDIFSARDTALCTGQTLLLDATSSNATYRWQDGSSQPQFNVTQSGTYSVEVISPCGDTKDSIVVSYEDCTCRFYIPSAFTPNHDGVNDVFLPKSKCLFTGYNMRVFNRWGQLLFESRNAATGWDGTSAGRAQPAGTYIWELVYKDNLTGKGTRKMGTILLIR